MAAWLVSAIQLIRSVALGTPLRALATGATAGTFIGPILESAGGEAARGGFLGFGGGERSRRRRRRRALTASDKVDIAFVAGILGQKAGKDLALIIAART